MPATWAAVGGKVAGGGQRLRVRARGRSQLPAGTSGTQGGDGPGAELTGRRTSAKRGRWPLELGWVGPQAEQARAAWPAGPQPVCLLEKQAPCPHGPVREPPVAGFVPCGWNQREPGCLQPRALGPRCALGQEKEEGAGHWPWPAGAAGPQPGRLRDWEAEVPGSRADGRVFSLWQR